MTIRVQITPGEKFGALTVTGVSSVQKIATKNPKKFNYRVWVNCCCSCGKKVIRDKRYLVAGNRMHCGKPKCKATRYE